MESPRSESTPAAVLGLSLLFLASGAAALVYEVAWTRRLLLVLGSTAAASAVVLAGFLGGLGLGGFLGGRLVDRSRRPLLLYGVFEIAAALWAVLFPALLSLLDGPFLEASRRLVPAGRTALGAALGVALVAPGAAALGATFPALLRHTARASGDAGRRTSVLYGANTVGAVLGALWAGWTGIFALGTTGAVHVAAAVAGVVGLVAVALGLSRRAVRPVPGPEWTVLGDETTTMVRGPRDAAGPPPVGRPPVVGPALAAACLCGFTALGLEAAGVRILVFFVEGFTASFAAMLAAFLLGLGLGSLSLGPLLARGSRPDRSLWALLLLAGLAALALAASLGRFEEALSAVRDRAYRSQDPGTAQRLAALAGSLLLFFFPGLLLGSTFPLAIRWARSRGAPVGRAAGAVYLWNSVGSATAPLLFLAVLPLGGALWAWSSVAALAVAAGAGGLVVSFLPRRLPVALAGLAAATVLATWAALALRAVATPSALVEASRVLRSVDARGRARTLLAVAADETTTASVVAVAGGARLLYTDDFQAAATGPAYKYMRLLGHLPALVAASQENAINVCFGTGTTAGALAAHPGVRRLEIVETSEAVLSLADHFRTVNRDVLEDPRVRVRVADGRHALALHAPDLDVVTLEPLMPYTPAALPFYTAEFYALARDRLREGGVLCQWIPVHAMPLDLYQALACTFFEAFPDSTLWFFEQSSVLVGRKGTAKPSVEALRARAAEVAKELAAGDLASPAVLGAAYVTTGDRFLAAVRARPAGPLSLERVTDERPFPEAYPAPRAGLATPYARDTLRFLASLVAPSDPLPREAALVPEDYAPLLREAARAGLDARAKEAEAQYLFALASGGGADAGRLASQAVLLLEDAVRGYGQASLAARGGDTAIVRRELRARRQLLGTQARVRLREARAALARGDASGAREKAEEAHVLARRAYEPTGLDAVSTERPEAAVLLGETLVHLGRCRRADAVVTDAAGRWPWEPRLRWLLSAVRARRFGHDVSLLEPEAAAFAASFGPSPCSDDSVRPAGPALERFAAAVRRGRPGEMRVEAEKLLFVVRDRGLPPDDVAAEVEATGDAPGPEVEAVRAALLRALRPSDPALPALLSQGGLARRRAAFLEAARAGFPATGLEAHGESASRDADPAVRAALATALALDPSPWARGVLGRLLSDEDAGVRRVAFGSVSARSPKEAAGFGYDPDAEPGPREEAAARLREWLGTTR